MSNFDRKRINGPEVSVPPLPLEDELADAPAVLDNGGLRADGRLPEAARPLFLRTNVVAPADGSAFVEQGKCKVLCAVYGPRPDRKLADPDQGRLVVELRYAPFALGKRRPFALGAEEKELSAVIHSALSAAVRLEAFPKASVEVHVQILEDDGTLACVAAGISAASMALADAGVEMFDVVAASSCGVVADDETAGSEDEQQAIVVDLTRSEERRAKGTLLLAYMPNVNQVAQVMQSGDVRDAVAEEAMDYCIDAAAEVHTLIAECLATAAAERAVASQQRPAGLTVVDDASMDVDA